MRFTHFRPCLHRNDGTFLAIFKNNVARYRPSMGAYKR